MDYPDNEQETTDKHQLKTDDGVKKHEVRAYQFCSFSYYRVYLWLLCFTQDLFKAAIIV